MDIVRIVKAKVFKFIFTAGVAAHVAFNKLLLTQ